MGTRDPKAYLLWYADFQMYACGTKTDGLIGKILKNEDTVESYKIEEKGFVVCVVNKVRPIPSGACG